MLADAEKRLDRIALAELRAERQRHSDTLDAIPHGDSRGLVAECELHLRNVEQIMRRFTGRMR